MQPTMCANFIYDLNGRKGPNKVGKDIGFMTAFYPADTQVVAPYPIRYLLIYKDDDHPTFTIGYGNASCRKKYGDDTKMANIEELKSVFVNNTLGYVDSSTHKFISGTNYKSSTLISTTRVYVLTGYSGRIFGRYADYASGKASIFCVKR